MDPWITFLLIFDGCKDHHTVIVRPQVVDNQNLRSLLSTQLQVRHKLQWPRTFNEPINLKLCVPLACFRFIYMHIVVYILRVDLFFSPGIESSVNCRTKLISFHFSHKSHFWAKKSRENRNIVNVNIKLIIDYTSWVIWCYINVCSCILIVSEFRSKKRDYPNEGKFIIWFRASIGSEDSSSTVNWIFSLWTRLAFQFWRILFSKLYGCCGCI